MNRYNKIKQLEYQLNSAYNLILTQTKPSNYLKTLKTIESIHKEIDIQKAYIKLERE